jgi:hypothetical protein
MLRGEWGRTVTIALRVWKAGAYEGYYYLDIDLVLLVRIHFGDCNGR